MESRRADERFVQPLNYGDPEAQTAEGPSAAVLCLVLRNMLNGPWDHAGAGAGVPGLWGTRGKSSGELADENAPRLGASIGLSAARYIKKVMVLYFYYF